MVQGHILCQQFRLLLVAKETNKYFVSFEPDSRSAHVSVGGVTPQCSFRGGRCLTRRQRRRVWQHPAPALPPLGEFQFPARQTSSPRSRRSSVDVARCECSAVDVARSCCSAVDVAWSCGSAVDVIRLCGSAVDVIRLCGSAVDLVRRLRSAVDVASDPLALPATRHFTGNKDTFHKHGWCCFYVPVYKASKQIQRDVPSNAHLEPHHQVHDDTTVVSFISKNESAYRKEVQQLPAWCKANNLSLNVQKSTECPFSTKHPRILCEDHQDHQIPWCSSRGEHKKRYSILSSYIVAWFGNCSISDRKTLRRLQRTAEKIIGVSLPSIRKMKERGRSIHKIHRICKASSIVDDPTHPSQTLFTLLPSRKRY
ncbi:hypothetical protein QTP70_000556 [Hemibagrus guttatus]|uniref:Uncharacterized protein n=1 Tax=Hemibagrus guttatus TaxID=175788 RepID=A0AAE0PSE8_9TELE|nr:hypothetical protein QTP70_000556 [Hemibagrus guttatus]KAK3523304.1 hypothetical protein QTP86_029518 [Hemibagrus guttatus]